MTADEIAEGRARLADIAATGENLRLSGCEDDSVQHEEAIHDWGQWLALFGERLLDAIEAERRDAARYRWLRGASEAKQDGWLVRLPENADAYADRAMSHKGGERG